MRVVRAQEEQHDRHAEQEFLGRRVLGSVVDLFPHVQVVVCPSIEFKRHSSNVVEHEVRSSHVRDVRQRPGCLLRHARHDVVEDLETHDENEVNRPCSCSNADNKQMSAFMTVKLRVPGHSSVSGTAPTHLWR